MAWLNKLRFNFIRTYKVIVIVFSVYTILLYTGFGNLFPQFNINEANEYNEFHKNQLAFINSENLQILRNNDSFQKASNVARNITNIDIDMHINPIKIEDIIGKIRSISQQNMKVADTLKEASIDVNNLTSTHQLLAIYKSLGAEIVYSNNVQAFVNIFQRDPLLWNQSLVESGHLTLRYPEYERPLPNFINDTHRELFLKNEKYQDILGKHTSSYYLRGDLELFSGGKISEASGPMYDCGQKTNMTEFKDSFPNGKVLQSAMTTNSSLNIVIGCPLLVPDSFAFQHFLDGVLPKIAQLTPFLRHPNMRFVMLQPRDAFITEMMNSMGITKDRIHFYEVNSRAKVNTDYQLNSCITPPTHPSLMKQGRKLLGVSETLRVPVKSAYIILLTRKGARNSGRNIVNQKQVVEVLQKRYDDRLYVFSGAMNIDKIKHLFSQARLIIGVHGGALLNLHFAPASAVVVEYLAVQSDGYIPPSLSHTIVWRLAQNAGQTYYRVSEDPINDSLDINVTISNLLKLVDEVDTIQLIK